jgi:hypothetical protein
MPIAIGVPGDEPLEIIPREKWAETIAENKKLDIDWNGPKCPIILAVELPFWLMVPESSISLTIEETTIVATIHNHYAEAQHGPEFMPSHANTVYIGPEQLLHQKPLPKQFEGVSAPVFRHMKTVVVFQAEVLADAIAAAGHTHSYRLNRAARYFRTLAITHIPFLNKLITSYRSASRDPFAHEVSDWDVPVWWAITSDDLIRVGTMPYWECDELPSANAFGSRECITLSTATAEDVQREARQPIAAGRLELLDAHSLSYRGRFGDAVRSAVTAIEVALESRIATVLRESGLPEQAIKQRLASTRDNFNARLLDYERLVRRRIPGPLISFIPYINGIRLKQELGWVRNLRHKIVHEGIRVDVFARGQMRRAIDTMTWLFDWLSLDTDGDSEGRNRNAEIFNAFLEGHPPFRFSYTETGVVIEDEIPPPHSVTSDEIRLAQYSSSITPEKCDLELFVSMSLDYFAIDHGQGLPDHREIPVPLERYVATICDSSALVFPLGLDGLMDVSHLASIALRKSVYTSKGHDVTALCVVNHQQKLDPMLRERENAISREVSYLAARAGITVILATDLCALVSAAVRYEWELDACRKMLVTAGWQVVKPPNYEPIGDYRRLYRRIGVMSVELQAGHTLAVGETIGLNIQGHYYEESVSSLHVDGSAVQAVTGPCSVGIATSLKESQLRAGQTVFRRLVGSPPQFVGEGI